jgi:hypothetical protein
VVRKLERAGREGRQTRRRRTFVDLAVVFKVHFLKEGDHLFYLLHTLNFYLTSRRINHQKPTIRGQ